MLLVILAIYIDPSCNAKNSDFHPSLSLSFLSLTTHETDIEVTLNTEVKEYKFIHTLIVSLLWTTSQCFHAYCVHLHDRCSSMTTTRAHPLFIASHQTPSFYLWHLFHIHYERCVVICSHNNYYHQVYILALNLGLGPGSD